MFTLVLAVVVGGLAASVVYVYVQRLEETSTEGQKLRSVLVASQSLAAGTSGADIAGNGGYEVSEIPGRYAEPGALNSPADLEGRVLADDIVAGEQLTSQRFEASEQDAFAAQFPPGTQALSLPVEHVRGVAGHVAAGDRLSAFSTTSNQGATKLIISKLPVVEVQPPAPDDPARTLTMTLAVTSVQATDLIHAQERGSLWFTLLTDKKEGS